MRRWDAIVVGGGVAGIAGAVAMARGGAPVLLIEARERLGGRASSVVDPRSGRVIDNGQHVVMGCCTAYLALLEAIGARDLIEWHGRQNWVEAGGRVSVVEAGGLPAPLHFAAALARAAFLDGAEKLAIGAAMAGLLVARRREWVGRTFGAFLARYEQPEGAVRKFWSPIVVSACNLGVDRVCAAHAMKVFQDGLLAGPAAAVIGVPRKALAELYRNVEEVVGASGGEVRRGASARWVRAREVEMESGEVVRGERVVCALPVWRAAEVVEGVDGGRDEQLEGIAGAPHSPIVGVHLTFDRRPIPYLHAVLVDRPTQWVFVRAWDERCLHAVVSAADEWMGMDEAAIVGRVMGDVRACFPESAAAALLDARVIKERRATLALTPEVEAVRPEAEGSRPGGVILAGDYVRTGWPATMEGAARSGFVAAALALGLERGESLPPELGASGLARLLSRRWSV